MSKGKLCISHIVLIFASFLSVFPLYYMVCGATNQSIDVVRGKLLPEMCIRDRITDVTKGTSYQGQAFPPFMQKIIDCEGLVNYINQK